MKKFKLIPKTKKGEERLRDIESKESSFTGLWIEQSRSKTVRFTDKVGPWLLLLPEITNAVSEDQIIGWFHLTHDDNFDVEEIN